MTTIRLHIDDATKKELDEMCDEMGMNIDSFFMVYVRRALRDRKIPFDIRAPIDPFYSEENQAQIRKADAQVRAGHVVVKSMDELEAMTGESSDIRQ